ncbi:MAG: hypothetical protein H6825_16305 [Planctomycetes bacterium]|nr:hypothetical protein [Planctomycetota bacterium]
MPVFRFDPSDADPRTTIYVDGTVAGFRGLSHWPGHSTPRSLAHDLSTGIALNFAALSPRERLEVLGPFDVVANNHYDTDGVLSAFAVLHPEQALRHKDLLLRAAATGDFCVWQGVDALAIELTVEALASHPESPVVRALPADADDHARHAAAYAYLLVELPALLGDPFRHRALFAEVLDAQVDEVTRVDALLAAGASDALSVERLPAHDLAVVRSDAPLGMLGVHRAAGDLWRVLHSVRATDGWRHRFVYRDASWFDLVSVRPLARVPLEPAVAALDALERARRAPDADAAWWCTSIAAPVAELGFSRPERRRAGFFEDRELLVDPASALDPDEVRDVLVERLAPDAGR